ncbi:MAG: T9SS type A sorting domain-containing protein, partial [Bacteroidetes bacterium]|nr:T9SS type A sorting domain-containing protein [Bacteroidota bacterium]
GSNGCSATATAVVDQDITAPGAQAMGGLIDCTTQSVMLHGYGNGTFSWSGPGGFTSTEQNPVVSVSGGYTLTVTGANGCTSTATAQAIPQECGGCDTPIILSCGPEVTTVECGGSIEPEDIGMPIIRKNTDCPVVNFLNYYDEFSGSCPITVTRHWTFRDEDGNEETCIQTIYIEDTTAPILMNVPADVTVYCDQVPPAPKDVWASDCKNDVSVQMTETTIPGTDASTYTIERTFTATDACGNTATETQVITVIECKQTCDTPIIIACGPAVSTVECGSSIDPEDIGLPIIRKNPDCPLVNYFNYYDEFSGSCPITVTRHWTFRDVDGNEETCMQTIYIEDTTAPVLSCGSSEITVDCNSIPEPEKCTATDNCGQEATVNMTEDVTKGDCGSGYTITRTYVAMDECGNTAIATQVIHVTATGGEEPKVMQAQAGHMEPIGQVEAAPNPFRHESTIRFTCNAPGRATVVVMDMLGHQVATLMDAEVEKGDHVALEFKPQGESGGLFFYRITLNGAAYTGKLMFRP